jgi:hypothetical protein
MNEMWMAYMLGILFGMGAGLIGGKFLDRIWSK